MTALTSVSPDNPSQGKPAQAQDDSLLRQPPQVPVPGANPMNTSELGANQISKATLEGDKAIASAKSQSSGGGGSPLGGIFGAVGSILGGLFSEGGPVGYAEGGSVNQKSGQVIMGMPRDFEEYDTQDRAKMRGLGQGTQDTLIEHKKMGANENPSSRALAAGYLVGALHQAKFGGTPETLHEAASLIKGMIGGDGNGMADGGPVDGNLANEELMKALGMQQPAPQVQQPQAQGANTPMQPQQQMPLGTQNDMMGGDPNAARGYAAGGQPGMPPQGQPMGAMPSLPTKSQGHMPYQPGGASQGAMGQPPTGMPGQAQGVPQQGLNTAAQHTQLPAQAGGTPQQPMGGASQGMMQKPPGFAEGGAEGGQGFEGDGKVAGPGGPTDDAIPAKLSDGEFVMSAAATQYWGVDKLAKMNDQGKQGFMQRVQQVDSQQPGQAPQADPMSAQGMPGLMQPPMQAAKGGAAVMRTKGSGYCGM